MNEESGYDAIPDTIQLATWTESGMETRIGSSLFEDTPEGMWRMDLLRRAVHSERVDYEQKFGAARLQVRDLMQEEIDARTLDLVLYGDVFIRDGKRVDPQTVEYKDGVYVTTQGDVVERITPQ